MQNIEYKSELRDIRIAREVCRSLNAPFSGLLEQVDTYYRVPGGKLKKRETLGEQTQVIFYERPSQAAPKVSRYTVYSVAQAEERFGREPLAVWVIVKKRRELYMAGPTRIHLDEVEGLGTFLEFESPVTQDHPSDLARQAVADLRRSFSPVLGEAIDCGYADLLTADREGGRDL